MQAVVYEGPFNIVVREVPKPAIQDATDVILKVELAGLCGSDLHMYRGHQKTTTGHIMGHEFVGTVDSVGSAIARFCPGDKVMSIFSPMCMSCWYCSHGYTNRCTKGPSFGSMSLDGGQSEFVRVPYADGTLEPIPADVSDNLMILMCDIVPTGYYGAMRAITKVLRNTDTATDVLGAGTLHAPLSLRPRFVKQTPADLVVVCLGCGPVGLCAVLAAKVLGAGTVYAVDAVDDRLAEAVKMGAEALKLGRDDVVAVVKAATEGRGADAVVESVGNKPAMRLALDVVRHCGSLSSIGFHQAELPFTGFEAYSKNIDLNMGRAAVRPVFGEALKMLADHQDKFDSFISHRMPLRDAPKAYALFEKQQARKVIFTLE